MMGKTTARLLVLLALSSLTACDVGLTKERRAEREEARYQEAMKDYKAGNLDRAVAGLEDVLRENPGNLSARFLLATMQYERKDCTGAFCNFREFTVLCPKGEKAEMARRRMALCEEQLAHELARKMNLVGNAAIARESETARRDLQTSENSIARLTKELDAAQKRIGTLERENAQLRRMVSSVGGEEPSRMSPDSVKDLLDDDGESDRPRPLAGERELLEGGDDDMPSPGGVEAAKELLADAEDDSGPVALDRPAESRTETAGPTARLSDLRNNPAAGRGKSGKSKEPAHEPRPPTYVVQEGDTLYRIAARFYGSQNQWKKIREANKATISTDGRVKAGQTIVLP